MAFPKNIDVDSTYGATSSVYGNTSKDYSTESLKASVYEYRYENGRRYHAYKEGKYAIPNDEIEQDRLDIMHHTYLILMDDKLHLAPIDPNPERILDIGTGTGIWAIDAGEKYPSAEVIGTDLSPIQPSWVPPNVHFEIDDAESDWTFRENYFDLVHIRHLCGGINDWEKLISEAYRACKPGGWIDIAEYEMEVYSDDNTVPDHLEFKKFYKLVSEAAEATGRDFRMANKLKPIIEKTGFTKVHHQAAKIPVGLWAADEKQKEMGAYILLSLESGFEAFGIQFFTNVLKMGVDDAQYVIRESLKQAKNRKIHGYGIHHLYCGQKPLNP